MAISSTDCRARVEPRRAVWYLVPDGVVQYIAKHRLYRRRGEPRSMSGRAPRPEPDPLPDVDVAERLDGRAGRRGRPQPAGAAAGRRSPAPAAGTRPRPRPGRPWSPAATGRAARAARRQARQRHRC